MLPAGHHLRIIVVGSSTGGRDALREFLSRMPPDAPPMPGSFVPSFAARLDSQCAMQEMKRAGACNLAQDEASCVVFGMPRALLYSRRT